ncbi:MAG: phosphosulfolactate synthase [Candidatus Latescibacterota bacterium]
MSSMNPDEHPFAGLDGALAHGRTEKPRTSGRTMVIDWGIPMQQQRDLTDMGAEYFDFAKIAVGLSRLCPQDLLTQKIDQYRSRDVEPFPGGQYLEYAEVHGKLDRYLPACLEAGYRWVEVSDNIAPVSLQWKERVITEAVEDYGLRVLGEVGRKEGLDNTIPLVDNARACMDAGASVLLVEAAELVSDDAETAAAVDEIVQVVGIGQVMFELPGPWIEGVHACDIHQMRRRLIDRYGSQVNIGNVAPDELMSMEAYRRGLGVNAGSG